MSDFDNYYETADAGSSKTVGQVAATIRKNDFIVINKRPCKVAEVSKSKTGKHGHAKCHFVAIDIFTGKKVEDVVPSSHNSDVPLVSRDDYQLLDITEDDYVSLMSSNGDTRDDLMLPDDNVLVKMMRHGFEAGKDLTVTVLCAMGEEQICAVKEAL